jgi:hypothetical protein
MSSKPITESIGHAAAQGRRRVEHADRHVVVTGKDGRHLGAAFQQAQGCLGSGRAGQRAVLDERAADVVVLQGAQVALPPLQHAGIRAALAADQADAGMAALHQVADRRNARPKLSIT